MKEIRTRIAPSPTGMMHLGTARTAIYCWAVARHFGGKFLLRIEDTDQKRSTAEATQVILDSMKWLNLDYDEGPIYQMDRLERYREVVDDMLAKGLAYKCYATPKSSTPCVKPSAPPVSSRATTVAGAPEKFAWASPFPKALNPSIASAIPMTVK